MLQALFCVMRYSSDKTDKTLSLTELTFWWTINVIKESIT